MPVIPAAIDPELVIDVSPPPAWTRIAAGVYAGQTPEDYLDLLNGPQDGERIDQLSSGRVLRLRQREMTDGGSVTVFDDITDRIQAAERLNYAATHDSLTGLVNRSVFKSHLAQRLTLEPPTPFAVMLIDIDSFKEVNDTYGHEIGDCALIGFAERLRQCEGVELLARLGGDEFAVVSASASAPEAAAVAGKLLEAGRRPFEFDGRFIALDVSIGAHLLGLGERDVSMAMRRADLALAAAKEAGRNGFNLFDDSLERRYLDRYELARDLKGALRRGELDIHYQPIYDSSGQRVVCMEALARWRHPTRGFVPPATFIPIAEASGLIGELGDWALRRAIRDAELWRDDITVAVNVSSLQAERPDFADSVERALGGLPPHRLQLEITESILLRVDETILATITRLRELGVTFALDDFGAGYASLAYLKAFPVDKIKIDRAFVKDIESDAHSVAIVGAIVALSRSFAVPSTAEGVETAAQFEALRALGVDSLQGYYFSKPKPIGEFAPTDILAKVGKGVAA